MVEQITQGLEKLDRSQLSLLLRYMEAMKHAVEVERCQSSDIADELFVSAASHYLSIHHATQSARLNKKEFEFLFHFASEAAGRMAVINPNSTDAGVDVTVDGTRYSLKTQADKNIKQGSLYIQKLMEARWARELVTPGDYLSTGIQNILSHIGRYERILVLKAYPPNEHSVSYELVEVPISVFSLLRKLKEEDIPPKNSAGTCSIPVKDSSGDAFRLVFDGSVEKIRIFNMRNRLTVRHAKWSVKV